MCLAIPVKISEMLDAETAVASVAGVKRRINVALVEDLLVGDYVILHVGYALSKLDPTEAERTLALMAAGDGADPRNGPSALGDAS